MKSTDKALVISKLRQIICNQNDDDPFSNRNVNLVQPQKNTNNLPLVMTNTNPNPKIEKTAEEHERNIMNVLLNGTRNVANQSGTSFIHLHGLCCLIGTMEARVHGLVMEHSAPDMQDFEWCLFQNIFSRSSSISICHRHEHNVAFVRLVKVKDGIFSHDIATRSSTSGVALNEHELYSEEDHAAANNKTDASCTSFGGNADISINAAADILKFWYLECETMTSTTSREHVMQMSNSNIQVLTRITTATETRTHGKKRLFKPIGRLDARYCLYVPETSNNIVNESPEYTFSLLEHISRKIDQETNLDMFRSRVTYLKSQKIKPHAESSIHMLLMLLYEISRLGPSYLSVKKQASIQELNTKAFDSSSNAIVSVFWFSRKQEKTDHQGSEVYFPYVMLNKKRNKLKFLAWYADVDETGFVRHSEINEGDVLSVRLAKHAKMLIYCENSDRMNSYISKLNEASKKMVISNSGVKTLKDKIKIMAASPLITDKLNAMPKINGYVFANQASSTAEKVIKNMFAFSKTKDGSLEDFMTQPA